MRVRLRVCVYIRIYTYTDTRTEEQLSGETWAAPSPSISPGRVCRWGGSGGREQMLERRAPPGLLIEPQYHRRALGAFPLGSKFILSDFHFLKALGPVLRGCPRVSALLHQDLWAARRQDSGWAVRTDITPLTCGSLSSGRIQEDRQEHLSQSHRPLPSSLQP